jgi:hypothetical protein
VRHTQPLKLECHGNKKTGGHYRNLAVPFFRHRGPTFLPPTSAGPPVVPTNIITQTASSFPVKLSSMSRVKGQTGQGSTSQLVNWSSWSRAQTRVSARCLCQLMGPGHLTFDRCTFPLPVPPSEPTPSSSGRPSCSSFKLQGLLPDYSDNRPQPLTHTRSSSPSSPPNLPVFQSSRLCLLFPGSARLVSCLISEPPAAAIMPSVRSKLAPPASSGDIDGLRE